MDVVQHESAVRLGLFAGVLTLMAAWELAAPRRRLTVARPGRWLSNLSLVALNTVVVRLLLPLGLVGVSIAARERGCGLLNQLNFPAWATVVLAVLALDLVIYLQHVLFHAMPLLWRLHRVHHADLDLDVTTGVRFHTLEILLSLGIKAAAVVLLGVPALAVVIFEALLNATSMVSHGNVCLPTWLDRPLRLVVVTSEMHRVHHSARPQETNSNYGFNLPWWDYLFGTYRAQPAEGHEGMTIGLEQFRDERQVARLPGMLALPLVNPVDDSDRQNGGRAFPCGVSTPTDAAARLSV